MEHAWLFTGDRSRAGLIEVLGQTGMVQLAFGVLFATGVTLLLVPCLYLLGWQIGQRFTAKPQAAALD